MRNKLLAAFCILAIVQSIGSVFAADLDTLRKEAKALDVKHNYKQSIPLWERVVIAETNPFEKQEDNLAGTEYWHQLQKLNDLIYLGFAYEKVSKYTEALKTYNTALLMLQKSGYVNEEIYSNLMETVGWIAFKTQHYSQAAESFSYIQNLKRGHLLDLMLYGGKAKMQDYLKDSILETENPFYSLANQDLQYSSPAYISVLHQKNMIGDAITVYQSVPAPWEMENEKQRKLFAPEMAPFKDLNTEKIQGILKPGQVLIDIVQGRLKQPVPHTNRYQFSEPHYLAFVVTPQTVVMRDLGLVANINPHVETVVNRIKAQQGFEPAAQVLLADTLGKLADLLHGAHRIYISPEGELNRVSFETLYSGQAPEMVYLSSGRDLLQKPASSQLAFSMAVFADPNFNLDPDIYYQRLGLSSPGSSLRVLPKVATGSTDSTPLNRSCAPGDVSDLKGALQEGQDLVTLFHLKNDDVFLQDNATEEQFKGLDPHRVLHLSTHGYFMGPCQGAKFVGNPLEQSGLLFAGYNSLANLNDPQHDGRLTAAEVAERDLRGTDLVVLSACETGLGTEQTGIGVSGLRWAFFHAGVQTLVTTLNTIDDTVTRQWMKVFYEGLKGGKSKIEAFQQAQQEIRQHYPNPYYWGNFILAGEPDGKL